MRQTRLLFVSFLFLFLGFHSMVSANPVESQLGCIATEEVTFDQLVFIENGVFKMDPFSDDLIPLMGVVNHAGIWYALVPFSPQARPPCGHAYGCRKCQGCNYPGCMFYCPGCRR